MLNYIRNCPNVIQNGWATNKSSNYSTALSKFSIVGLSNLCFSGKCVGPLDPKPHVETGLVDAIPPQHPAKKEFWKPTSHANRILTFVRKIKRAWGFSWHPQSASPVSFSLSGFIYSFLSTEAGRDGSGGDSALRKGLQQAQGPQHPLTPGPPAGNGLPGTHRVSTVPPLAPGCVSQPLWPVLQNYRQLRALTSCRRGASRSVRYCRKIRPFSTFYKWHVLCSLKTNWASWLAGWLVEGSWNL